MSENTSTSNQPSSATAQATPPPVQQTTTGVDFKAAPLALTTMIDEYTKERERAGILDNKALALITILIALVTVYIPLTPFDKIQKIYASNNKDQLIVMVILLVFFIGALVVTGLAFTKLISLLKLKTYNRVDVEQVTDDNFLISDEHTYAKALCKHYKSLILQNSHTNKIKADKLGNCFILTIVSFLLLLVSCIGLLII